MNRQLGFWSLVVVMALLPAKGNLAAAEAEEPAKTLKTGHPRPGNTIVGTTCLPAEAEAIFRDMIRPHVETGQVRIVSHYYPVDAELAAGGRKLVGIHFRGTQPGLPRLLVRAGLTIDASDWGEAIQVSTAPFDCGPDLRDKYGEPSAPTDPEAYPPTEMNPITWCLIVEQTDQDQLIPKPPRYDERRYLLSTSLTQQDYADLGWAHRPHRPFASVEALYRSRRLIDSQNLQLSSANRCGCGPCT